MTDPDIYEALARNTMIAGTLSSETFRTDIDGEPAVGVTKGLWTVTTTFDRTAHGLFVPRAVSMHPRKKQE